MNFGARVLKTGLAVTLALYLATLLKFSSPTGAGIAAIFAMQPSIYRSWRHFLDQIQTSTAGAVIALLGGMLLSNQPIAVGIVCILVIMLSMKMNRSDTIGLTLVTVISVMEGSGEWQFALTRFLVLMTGIVSAFVINIFVFPPKPRKQYINQIERVFNSLSLLMRTAVSHEMKESVFRDEKNALEGSIRSLADKYALFEEEQKQLRKPKYSQTRQMVVYKNLLSSLQKGYEVLDAVDRHYFQAMRSEETDVVFDRHLELLIKYHEHILLKFQDKIKPGISETEPLGDDNDGFLESVVQGYRQGNTNRLRLAVVAGAIYDYGYQLERLDRVADQINRASEDMD
ncbi:FUSC family protein [Paenibacillus rhizophilus]|uniref:Aromatic acid exporter family protein n=1 Tax=Paenibacillus rhizophilus TaxID=1850366 RepID=A0A3N9PC28_9BACL|nr:aromatic acid exporter family protein [Paenibacillus rhizophilus]RQW13788.1 aromatic acid exporter family protein [Paenibacillus rhizophilus]